MKELRRMPVTVRTTEAPTDGVVDANQSVGPTRYQFAEGQCVASEVLVAGSPTSAVEDELVVGNEDMSAPVSKCGLNQ
jgi:hypothetical protein